MVSSQFSIAFDFVADHGHLTIRLAAEVELHHSQVYYLVKNFHSPSRAGTPVLPDIRIKKLQGRWVHADSEKETDLSEAVGRAVDRHEHSGATS